MKISKTGLLFFFMSIPLITRAQANRQVKLDSLYSLWQDHSKSDSSRVTAYREYVWNGFLLNRPDTAYILADKLFIFGKQKDYPLAMAEGFRIRASSWYLRGEYPLALEQIEKSLVIYEEIDYPAGIAACMNNLGLIYAVQGYYADALSSYSRSLKIYEQAGDRKGMSVSLINIGSIYKDQGDMARGLDCYSRSLKIKEEIGDTMGMAVALNNLGIIYNDLEYYNEALMYFDKSLSIKEKFGDMKGMAIALNNMGAIYKTLGKNGESLKFYSRSLNISEKLGYQSGVQASIGNIGVIYMNQGEYQKAQDHFARSLKMAEQTGDEMATTYGLINFGKLHFLQHEYARALDYCHRALGKADKIKIPFLRRDACKCLFDVYKAKGDNRQALEYYELLNIIKDSINHQETAKQMQFLEFQKQVFADSMTQVEKDRRVQLTHEREIRKKRRGRNIAFGSGALALLLAGSFHSRWRYVKRTNKMIREERDRSEHLLLNILPSEIALELKEKGRANARDFDRVTILFTDFKDFTQASEKLSAHELVGEINICFEAFDQISEKYGIEKIKTIGDSYMAAGGLPIPTDDSVKNTVMAGLEMADFVLRRKVEREKLGHVPFEMRTGINTGPAIAGIVGVKKFQYDIWGDTVNTASRMESYGVVGKVNISESTYNLIKDEPEYSFETRGRVDVKGKGMVEMYFVSLK